MHSARLFDGRTCHDLALLQITHDLGVVAAIADEAADRVIVMYLGLVVGEAKVDALFENPKHPYSAALIAATLVPEPGHALPQAQLSPAAADSFAAQNGCALQPDAVSLRPRAVK